MNKPFSLLIKPASADCNLRCTYCFYLEKAALYPEMKTHRMSEATLKKLIASYMRTDQSQYSFGWQGGEPTLMGVDFFKSVTQLQQKFGKTGDLVANGLQTNGILIDDAFAEHLAEYRFLVGVSLDGPPEIHNRYRVTRSGHNTHDRVLKGIHFLKKHGVAFNILVLVNAASVDCPQRVYDFLVDHDFHFHQYIPCVEWDKDGHLTPFSITGRAWGEFLCGIFDRWVQRHHEQIVSIRHFDSIMAYLVQGTKNVCIMGSACDSYFLVEHNGDVYPCDFFVAPERKIGNIHTHDFRSLQESKAYTGFGQGKSQYDTACRECRFVDLCQGDCPKHRYFHGHANTALSWLCEGWQIFYQHTLDRFMAMAEALKKEQAGTNRPGAFVKPPDMEKSSKTGRNAPCPCGSGKKYKRCCGRG